VITENAALRLDIENFTPYRFALYFKVKHQNKSRVKKWRMSKQCWEGYGTAFKNNHFGIERDHEKSVCQTFKAGNYRANGRFPVRLAAAIGYPIQFKNVGCSQENVLWWRQGHI
jgi:hypothetical protein